MIDCEQFDRHAIELLYDEAPKGVSASLSRHLEHCDRCASHWAQLHSARKLIVLAKKYDAPAHIEANALQLAQELQRHLPRCRKMASWVSWAGAYSMRPQIAMVVLLVLMVGSGLILLRSRPGGWQMGVVRVTERGVPEGQPSDGAMWQDPMLFDPASTSAALADLEHGSEPKSARMTAYSLGNNTTGSDGTHSTHSDLAPPFLPTASNAKPVDADTGNYLLADASSDAADINRHIHDPSNQLSERFAEALRHYNEKNYQRAYPMFDRIAMQGGSEAAAAAMYAAKSVRISAGCLHALPRFSSVAARYPGSAEAIEAKWQEAACARIMGDYIRARVIYYELAKTDAFRQRAEKELARIPPGSHRAPSVSQDPPSVSPSAESDSTNPAAAPGTAPQHNPDQRRSRSNNKINKSP